MAGGSSILGSRVGAGPMGEAERGEAAPRIYVSFWCANGHESRPSFATDAEIPEEWDCARCGLPAGPDKDNPPAPPKIEPYKTHLAYVKERRSDKDGAQSCKKRWIVCTGSRRALYRCCPLRLAADRRGGPHDEMKAAPAASSSAYLPEVDSPRQCRPEPIGRLRRP